MEQKNIHHKYLWFLNQAIKDWRFWVKLLIGICQLFSIIIFIIVSTIVERDSYSMGEQLSYFTTLSNLLSAIFFIYSAMFHHQEGKGKFDNDGVGQIVVTYLMLTVLIYNINQLILKNPYFFESWKYIMSFVCEHSLVPILAIIYYLFFYNHEKIEGIKEFSKKWIWYMIAGLIGYLALFSIIGFLGKAFHWKQLFWVMGWEGQRSNFVYPFMDWYNGFGLLHPAWLECILAQLLIILISTGFDYLYTLSAIQINKSKLQDKILNTVQKK